MKTWDNLINKAMLGSSKESLTLADLPDSIVAEFNISESHDPEENFLRLSSMVYQFRQAGARPLNIEAIVQSKAEKEEKPYCSPGSISVLQNILDEELPTFLELWLTLCANRSQILWPAIIPTLFEIAERRTSLKNLIVNISGKRGEWLMRQNPDWTLLQNAGDDPVTIWQNGTMDKRKELLRSVRITNKGQSISLLESSWSTEGVNEKLSFLEILKKDPGTEDLLWLENLKEKSQKVNALIIGLLKSIPSSAIVQKYQAVLKSAFEIKTGKALLGMISKTRLNVKETLIVPDELFQTGIEKLSSDKNISDNQFILVQLITSVPPAFWNDHLEKTDQEVIELFQKEKNTGLYLPAIAIAAINFRDQRWIKSMLDHGDETILSSSIPSLIEALNAAEKDSYAGKYFNAYPYEIIQLMKDSDEEWTLDLAKTILKFTAGEIYQFNKSFYRSVSTLIPVEIVSEMDSFIPMEEAKKVYWKNQSEELTRLLTLKKHILQSFNS